MVLTINPAVSGTRRLWLRDVFLYLVGTILGAIASLALAVFLFATMEVGLGDDFLPILSIALVSLGLLHQIGAPVPVPYRKEQVPEWWRNALPAGLVPFSYASVLGFGFLTPFTSSAHLAFLSSVPLVTSIPGVIISVGLFALGKSAVLVLGRGSISLDEVRHRLPSIDLSRRRRRFARAAANAGVTCLTLGSLFPLL